MSNVQPTKEIEKVKMLIEENWNEQLLFLKSIGSYKSTLGNEKGVQDFIQKHLEDMKLETNSMDPDPKRLSHYNNFGKPEWPYKGRPVVVGKWKTNGPTLGKSLILQGHVDVVSAEPEYLWDTDPYNPSIKENKMYGRGICDMKSGVSAMIYAVKAIQQSGIELASDLQIQTVTEEECTGNGALALLDKGFVADGALIPEPTELRMQSSIVGVLWVRVIVKGSGAHVERAEKAVNAINKAAYLVQVLDDYREFINNRAKHTFYSEHPHPLNVNVGVIKGGDWPSNVPSECIIEARVGFYPNQKPEDIKEEVKEWILEAAKKDKWLKEVPPEVEFFGFNAPGMSKTDKDAEMLNAISRAHKLTTMNEVQELAFTATTDTRAFREFDIPTTCYGPAGGNMHGTNEYIDLESLETATKTIAAFILDWCKVRE